MRKKILAILLAVVMAVGLLPVAAFAADEDIEPGITVNVEDSEALRLPETTFTLRGWEQSYDNAYHIARSSETDEYTTVEAFYELPLGVTLTITTAYPLNMANTFYAWSDHDDDGVYDQWIWLDRDSDMSPFCSPSEPGPFTTGMYGTDFSVNGAGGLMGNDAAVTIPITAQITSDYLTELFGPNTLLDVYIAAGVAKQLQYNFLLTGEQVGSGAEDPAEPEPEPEFDPSITMNVEDLDALRIEGTTFRLQEWSVEINEGEEEDWLLLLTKGEPADYTSESLNAYELPLGVTLTVEAADPGQEFTNGSNVSVAAWSDPDGDGVYNRRIYAETQESAGLLPASEEGPFKVYLALAGGYFFANEDGVVNGDGFSGIEYAPSYSWTLPTTFQITSDYLTEYYGANTLVQISILIDRETETYAECYFLLTGEQAGPETEEPTFSDVDPTEWYAAAVNWGVENNYVLGHGDGTFGPYEDCTHIQILTFLWRAAGWNESAPEAPVAMDPNVPQYQLAANWAYDKGMIDENFDPDKDCTRADAVMYIWQAFGKKDAPDYGFTDVDAGAPYAKAVDWAADNGITVGDDAELNTFNPTKVCDRGEIVTFLHRAYVEAVRVK